MLAKHLHSLVVLFLMKWHFQCFACWRYTVSSCCPARVWSKFTPYCIGLASASSRQIKDISDLKLYLVHNLSGRMSFTWDFGCHPKILTSFFRIISFIRHIRWNINNIFHYCCYKANIYLAWKYWSSINFSFTSVDSPFFVYVLILSVFFRIRQFKHMRMSDNANVEISNPIYLREGDDDPQEPLDQSFKFDGERVSALVLSTNSWLENKLLWTWISYNCSCIWQ